MKVLRVHNHYQQAGGESAVEQAERELLRRAGHEVVVYERHNDEIAALGPLGRAKVAAEAVWSTRTHRELKALLARERPDVAHFTNTFPLISPSAHAACRAAGVPVVQSLHNYRLVCPGANLSRAGRPCEDCLAGSLWSGVRHRCYRGSRAASASVATLLAVHRARGTWQRDVAAFIALCEFSRSRLVAGGLPAERIRVIPNFTEPDPGPRRGSGEYALYAGRLSPEKGVDTLVRAWAALGDEVPLRIAGDGPERAALESAVTQAGLQGVHFLGALPRPRLLEALQRARFLVLPSRVYENFPLVIAEAFACGVPVLASRLGAMAELVEDGRTGRHFTPGDPRSLAEAVRDTWRDPKRSDEWGHNARAAFEARYTAERHLAALIDLYAEVVAGR